MHNVDPGSKHDISLLENLRSIRICADDRNEDMDANIPKIQHYLSQLQKHTPHLEEISIVICYENDKSLEALSVFDRVLSRKGFENLRVLQFEVHFPPNYEWTATVKSVRTVFRELKEKFPLVQKRATIKTVQPRLLYPWFGTGRKG